MREESSRNKRSIIDEYLLKIALRIQNDEKKDKEQKEDKRKNKTLQILITIQ